MLSMLLFPIKLVQLAAAGAAVGAGWKIGSWLGEFAIGHRDVAKAKVEEFLHRVNEHPWLGKVLAAAEAKAAQEDKQSA